MDDITKEFVSGFEELLERFKSGELVATLEASGVTEVVTEDGKFKRLGRSRRVCFTYFRPDVLPPMNGEESNWSEIEPFHEIVNK